MKRSMVTVVLMGLMALLLAACGGGGAVDVPDTVEVTIEMHDVDEFSFDPEDLEFWVGQEVTLHFVNVGEKEHEFMVGKDVDLEAGFPNGYEVDFFADLEPVVLEGMAMRDSVMIMPEGMEMDEEMDMSGDEDMSMEEGEHDEDMAMDEEGDMAMEEDEHEEDMAMEEDEHTEEEAGHDDHHGFMVMVPSDAPEATISFTVTADMVGEWEFGCFEDDGQHYDDGMVGTLTIHDR